MSDPKDPAIKLFGKTIPLPELPSGAALSDDDVTDSVPNGESSDSETEAEKKETLGGKLIDAKKEDETQPMSFEELTHPDETSVSQENPKTPPGEAETALGKKPEEEQTETSVSQEKTLKKPDKILPCPRCNSMDTKFCYFNNYNVNQARHFCKKCQRYWTAGGTMRNVPVGAGRRKSKNSASHFHHIVISEALQHAQTDIPSGLHHPSLRTNGTVLTFGSDSPVSEPMASVLKLAEKTALTKNGLHKPEDIKIPVSYVSRENGDHCSSGSPTVAPSKDEADKNVTLEPVMQNCQGFTSPIPCFPGAPWTYSWNPAQWSSPVSPPGFFHPGFPITFYPTAPYWGCAVPGSLNIPLCCTNTDTEFVIRYVRIRWAPVEYWCNIDIPWLSQPPSPNQTAPTYGPNSPTLGKHSREEDTLKPGSSPEDDPCKDNNSKRCLWIPKTLRIDDLGQAAKSSIWATLGIKSDKGDSIGDGRLFKAFRSKVDEMNHLVETSPVLQANPAALSRSLKFQESS